MARVKFIFVSVLITFTNVFVPLTVRAAADTCTWTGLGGDNTWGNAANWSDGAGPVTECDGAGIPESGDDIVFPAGASQLTNSNSIAGLTLNSVTVSGSGYTISGNALTIAPTGATTLVLSGANNIWSVNTTLDGTTTSPSVISSGANNAVGANIVLTAGTPEDFAFLATSGNTLMVSGVVSGTASYVTGGNTGGTVRFNNLNTFTVTNSIQLGGDTYICESATCMGDATNNIELYNAAEFMVDTASSVAYDIAFKASTATLSSRDQSATLTGAISTDPGVSAIIAPGTSASFILNGNYTNGGTTNYGGNAQVVQNGTVSGGGALVVNNSLTLVNGNTFTNSLIINNGGRVTALHSNSLGTTAGATQVSSGGSLLITPLGGAITIPENISVAGTGDAGLDGAIELYSATDDVTFSGNITLTGNSTFANALASSGTARMFFSGVIGGTGNITLKGVADAGSILFTGPSSNTYSGATIVDAVRFFPSKNAAGITAVPGNLEIRAFGVVPAHVETSFSENIANSSNILLVNSTLAKATLAIGSTATETVNTITGDGDLILGHGSRLLTASSVDFTFAGRLGKFSSFTADPTYLGQVGSGMLIFTGSANTTDYGSARVDLRSSGGSIVINGSSLVDTDVVIESGGTLKGTSPVGDAIVLSGGAVNVGNSPGCMGMASLTLNSGSTFTEEIAGTTACTQYDQTTVTGTANLGGATLSVSLSTTPANGTVFTIINAGSVIGTFNGLADGATLTVSGVQFRINYAGTAVTLTKIGGTLSATGDTPLVYLPLAILLVALAISRKQYLRS